MIYVVTALAVLATIGYVWMAYNYTPERPPSQGWENNDD